MTLNLYDVSVPAFINGLSALSHILKKAVDHGIPEAELLDSRIHADMKPLTFQIHTASYTIAIGVLVEITGVERVAMEDNAKTVAELQARIARAVELLKAADRMAFDGKGGEGGRVEVPGWRSSLYGDQLCFEHGPFELLLPCHDGV